MDLDALHSYTFTQLQNKCKSKGLSKSGTKKQLILRLKLLYSTNGQLLTPAPGNDEQKFNYSNIVKRKVKTNTKQKSTRKPPPPPPPKNNSSKSINTQSKNKNTLNYPSISPELMMQIHNKSKTEYNTLKKAVSELTLNLDTSTDSKESSDSNHDMEYNTLSPINKNQFRRTKIRGINHNKNKLNDNSKTYSICIANHGMGIGFVDDASGKVTVSEVLQNSRAMVLGISKGDILIKINDIEIKNADEYYEYKLPFTATFKHTTATLEHPVQKKKVRAHSMPPIKKLKMFHKDTVNISEHIIQCSAFQFDKFGIYPNKIGVCFVVSRWYVSPEWKIKIIKSDSHRQEIGIVSNINECKISNDGLIHSNELGAKCFLRTDDGIETYYASINEDGKQRSYSKVNNTNINEFCWHEGDVVRIKLNVKKWTVKFYLNDVKIKKAISIEPNQVYYPVIAFIGDCRYEINPRK